MAKVELKKPVIDEIKAHLDGAKTVVLADYLGLTVEEDTNLRRQLRENNVIYKVYKNTMVNFAIKGTEFEALSKDLHGATAIAISKEDATIAARVLNNFAKTAPELELKAGIVEGEYYDHEGIQVIANIPSREELLAKFLGSLKAPVTNFALAVKAIADKKEQEGN
ncbi:MAG: 50S ribosomal protein L10 [Eubacteriales bacterium]|nr:50S ribosomal protein L10 [Eubacteriales bacterium]